MKLLFTATLLLISVFGIGNENLFVELLGIDYNELTETDIKANAQEIIKSQEEEKNAAITELAMEQTEMEIFYEDVLKQEEKMPVKNNEEIKEIQEDFTKWTQFYNEKIEEINKLDEEFYIAEITESQKAMEEALKEAASILQEANCKDKNERRFAVLDTLVMFENLLEEVPFTDELMNYIDEPLEWQDLCPDIQEQVESMVEEAIESAPNKRKHITKN